MGAILHTPGFSKARGPRYWLNPLNWWQSRKKILRFDYSNEWRYEYLRDVATPPPPAGFPSDPDARTRPYTWLLGDGVRSLDPRTGFRFVILGDTGEGDASQYTLLPIIRALDPHFMIINGDVAYPSGNSQDFTEGFFLPYSGLNIPIWAVPGNHEYYSDGKGKEFFETFCSNTRTADWVGHQLIPKPQPGSYWELSEPGIGLTILGVDGGQTGYLDGKAGTLGILKRKPDEKQHAWLDWRLNEAQQRGDQVVVLFHFPGLDGGEAQKVGLGRVHHILAHFPCVQLVVAAHVHNMQCYDAGTFRRYQLSRNIVPPTSNPSYFVSGCGGATVSAPEDGGTFPANPIYPDIKDFRQYAQLGIKATAALKLGGTTVGDVIARALRGLSRAVSLVADMDLMKLQSLLLVEWSPVSGTRVTPYYVRDLEALYPAGTQVQVQPGVPPLSQASLTSCAQTPVIRF